MKQIIYILFLLLTFCACNEEVIAPYEGDCGMYFDVQQTSLDTLRVAWGLKDSEIKEQTVNLTVRLFGDVATYERKFSIDIISYARWKGLIT